MEKSADKNLTKPDSMFSPIIYKIENSHITDTYMPNVAKI